MSMEAFFFRLFFLFFIQTVGCNIFAQGLETLPPIRLDAGSKPSEGNLIISVSDFEKFFKNGGCRYADCIEIIDAAKPWPPIWFSAAPLFRADTISKQATLNLITNFSYQSGLYSFYKEQALLKGDIAHHKIDFTNKHVISANYVICSPTLKVLETLKPSRLPFNFHCMAINDKKERLVMLQLDTVLAIKTPDNPLKKPIAALIDVIAIYDSTDKVIFKWNPVKALGLEAVNPLYIHAPSASVSGDKVDWSHGNSIVWDLDGNILYSFRHIGVGKISRADGHVIWRLDNKSIYTDNRKDTLVFYLQHDIEPVKVEGDYTRYSLFSNGDFAHPKAFGLDFKANNKDGSIKFIRKRYSTCNLPSTGAGNYEVDEHGNYILNYGVTPDGSDKPSHTFCEMAQSDGHVFASYSLPKNVFAFKISKLKAPPVTGPMVSRKGNVLSAHGNMAGWIWYRLENDNSVIKVAQGVDFKPGINGTYYVAGKVGMGYAVSEPFLFKQ